jgi:hypothetical protein
MKFGDVPQFTRSASWQVDISWRDLERWIESQLEQGLDLDPDFQRGHVWTPQQQTRYVEFIMRGGQSGKDILTNHPNWQTGDPFQGPYVLVDGKQRLAAVLGFLRNQVPAFEHYFRDYDGSSMRHKLGFKWHVNDLKTRAEVLQWYLDTNFGGTPHTEEELRRIQQLLATESSR